MATTQAHKAVAVSSPLGDDVLLFRQMSGTERLGRPFDYRLELLSEDGAIALSDVLGQPLAVRVELPDGAERHFHGLVSRFSHVGTFGNFARYQARVRPWLWLLTRTADCRIFQEMTAPEIIMQVFRDHGFTDFEDALGGEYRTREYCVQYRETDFQFVSRLMEQEGIYYYFKHAADKHTLVLSDSISAHAAFPGYEQVSWFPPDEHRRRLLDHLEEWLFFQDVQPGQYVHDDYDFERPQADLLALSRVDREHAAADYVVYDYPGGYIEQSDGEAYARARIEERQAQYEQAQGRGNCRGLATGFLFTLDGHPRSDQNREHLVVSAAYAVRSNEYESVPAGTPPIEYDCRVTAIDSQQPYRAASVTRKPTVQGPQTAVVVGPEDQEIWTDQYGRVKVQFHWDRYGESDENSSCWIRVAQSWAGKTWGWMALPRIGQEVIVDFLEGDPDRPIITGRVYNADQMPPYALPDNQTQTVFKSRSTPGGTDENFNELRFDDEKDAEHIYFHAEKDFVRVVENNDTLAVGFDKRDPGDRNVWVHNNHVVIVGNDEADDGSQTITIWNNRTETVKEGNETVTIEKGNRTVNVDEGNDLHEVKQGNRTVKVNQGNDTLTVSQGNQSIKVTAGKSTIEAGQSIELKVGGSSIKIEAAKITIKAPQIAVQADGTLDIKGPMATVSGDGMLTLKGGMVQIN